MTGSDFSGLSKEKPWRPLVKKMHDNAGRNSAGRITTRHQGGGVKKLYRMVDFSQTSKLNVPAHVERLEYDPYRTAFIALLLYRDGSRSYVLAAEGMKVGDEVMAAPKAELKSGNRLQIKNIPIGYRIYNVEMMPGKGGQLARSAGSYLEVLAHEGNTANIKLASGEVRRVFSEGYATIGQVSNAEHNLVTIGKAGRSRWLGIRPTVRGSVMNPVDHPYGGGEGRQRRGTKRPKTAWGKVTGGRKTRKPKKWSNPFILQRRPK